MVMRLVRDDQVGPLDPLTLREQFPGAGPGAPAREGEAFVDEMDDAEHKDGAVEDADEDSPEAGGEGDSALQSVDLTALEALLMGTHHPLTAGRLAELLDLESTK